MTVVTNEQRVNTITKYYAEYRIKQTLSIWKSEERWAFLDKVKIEETTFNAYKTKPVLINSWKTHYIEPNVANNFNLLTSQRQIEWLEGYGNSDELFLRTKNNPDTILSFNKYSDEPELISKIKNYSNNSKEEIIFFERYGSKNEEWFQIFKHNPSKIVFELGLYNDRIIKVFNSFRYEMLIGNNQIAYNVLTENSFIMSWPNKAWKKPGGILSFDFNTSGLKSMDYNVKNLGKKWVDDTFEIWEPQINKVEAKWTFDTEYPDGVSKGYLEYTNKFEETYNKMEALKSTSFYQLMRAKGFNVIEDINDFNYDFEIIVVLKRN